MATNKQLDQQGETAKKLYNKIADSTQNYNDRRKEQTKALRDALAPIWAALADGKAVNGQKNRLSWCRWANPVAKHPERYFYQVMQDKAGLKSLQSKRKKKQPQVVHVEKGATVAIGNQWFYVIAINDAVDRKVQNPKAGLETKTTLALDVMRLSIHWLQEDGPACKPPHMRKRHSHTGDYPYTAKGEKPTCSECLRKYEASKPAAKAAAA